MKTIQTELTKLFYELCFMFYSLIHIHEAPVEDCQTQQQFKLK